MLYPYVIEPKLTTAIWGGSALVSRFNKHGDRAATTGESWECWDENQIANGPLKGMTLALLRERLGANFLGNLDPLQIFPILTKLIDARAALSVQVHPDDAYAQRVEGQRNGKTECWYVLEAQPGAELVLGWVSHTSREEYERRVADGSLGDILRRVPVKAGEAYYIPAGTLHAIGAGVIIFETQQASDLTYRIFDWNRVDASGKPRELHVSKAADVLNYHADGERAIAELRYEFEGIERAALIAAPHFVVERLHVTRQARLRTEGRPLILMTLAAGADLRCEDGAAALAAYTTAIVPAAAQYVDVLPAAGSAQMMFVTPPASPDALAQRLRSAGIPNDRIETFQRQFHDRHAPQAGDRLYKI